jgi:transcriptional regulator with XRE-family HTH domain
MLPVRHRPVFYEDLGRFFADLRVVKGWTQRQAVDMAQRRGLVDLTRQTLFRLERGQTKNPDPAVLHALAELYDLPYEQLVARFVERRYGVQIGGADTSETDLMRAQNRELAKELTGLRTRHDGLRQRVREAIDLLTDLEPMPSPGLTLKRSKTGTA